MECGNYGLGRCLGTSRPVAPAPSLGDYIKAKARMWRIARCRCRFAFCGIWQLYTPRACSTGIRSLPINLSKGLMPRAIRCASSLALRPGIDQGNKSPFRCAIASHESATDGLRRFLEGANPYRTHRHPLSYGQGRRKRICGGGPSAV